MFMVMDMDMVVAVVVAGTVVNVLFVFRPCPFPSLRREVLKGREGCGREENIFFYLLLQLFL